MVATANKQPTNASLMKTGVLEKGKVEWCNIIMAKHGTKLQEATVKVVGSFMGALSCS